MGGQPPSYTINTTVVTSEERPSKKSHGWLIFFVALTIITAIGIGGFLYYRSSQDPASTDTSTSSPTELSEGSTVTTPDPLNYFKLKPHKLPLANHFGLNKADFLYETVPVKIADSTDTSLTSFCFERVTEDRFSIWMSFLKTVLGTTGLTSADKETLNAMIADLEQYRERNEDLIDHTWFAYTTVSHIKNHKDMPAILPQFIESFMMVLGAQHFQVKVHSPIIKCPQYVGTVEAGKAQQHQDLPKLLNGWASKATLIMDPATRLTVLPRYNWIPNMAGDQIVNHIAHDASYWSASYQFLLFTRPDNPTRITAFYSNTSESKKVWKLGGVYRKNFTGPAARSFNWLLTFDLDQMKGANPFLIADLYDPDYAYVQADIQNVSSLGPINWVKNAESFLRQSCRPGALLPASSKPKASN